MQGQDRLLFYTLDRHKPHAGPRDRFANCLCVIAVVFTALAIRHHKPGRHQSRVVAQLPELSGPLVCSGARLHTDDTRRQLRDDRQQLAAVDCPAHEHIAMRVDAMQGEHVLRQVDSQGGHVAHRLPLSDRFVTHAAAILAPACPFRDGERPLHSLEGFASGNLDDIRSLNSIGLECGLSDAQHPSL
jgi:hypothetical protein